MGAKYNTAGDEYSKLKDYESGDPVSRIDLKRLAKNDEVLVKETIEVVNL